MVAALTGLATTGANVWADRPQARPLRASELPALLVTTGAETIAASTIHAPTIHDRALQVHIIATARTVAALDDVLDAMALDVETALGAGSLLSGAVSLRLEGIEQPWFDASGDTPVARQVLRYQVLYCTAAGAPQTIL